MLIFNLLVLLDYSFNSFNSLLDEMLLIFNLLVSLGYSFHSFNSLLNETLLNETLLIFNLFVIFVVKIRQIEHLVAHLYHFLPMGDENHCLVGVRCKEPLKQFFLCGFV